MGGDTLLQSKKARQVFIGAVLISAFTHIIFLVIATLLHGDISYLNFFHVLGADAIFPGITEGIVSFILSYVVFGLFLCISYGVLWKK